jgi:hypothetical protein
MSVYSEVADSEGIGMLVREDKGVHPVFQVPAEALGRVWLRLAPSGAAPLVAPGVLNEPERRTLDAACLGCESRPWLTPLIS